MNSQQPRARRDGSTTDGASHPSRATNGRLNIGPWSQIEDQQLIMLAKPDGHNNWSDICTKVTTRNAKQCRERWHQHLHPRLDHSPITKDEGELIEHYVQLHSTQWANISRMLPKMRSDNDIKNWWNNAQNRQKRKAAARRQKDLSPSSMDSNYTLDSARHSTGHSARNSYSAPAVESRCAQPESLNGAARFHFGSPNRSPAHEWLASSNSTWPRNTPSRHIYQREPLREMHFGFGTQPHHQEQLPLPSLWEPRTSSLELPTLSNPAGARKPYTPRSPKMASYSALPPTCAPRHGSLDSRPGRALYDPIRDALSSVPRGYTTTGGAVESEQRLTPNRPASLDPPYIHRPAWSHQSSGAERVYR